MKQFILIMIDSLRLDTFRSPELSGFSQIRDSLTEINNVWCGSYPTIPCRTDIMLGELSFLKRRWGSLPNDSTTLQSMLSKHGINTALITDNHIIVDTQCGGNFQKGFTFWEFERGHESDQWAWDEPSDELPPADHLTRDAQFWEQYRRNYARMKKYNNFSFSRMLKSIKEFVIDNKRNDFMLWIDCYSLHEPWCPGHLSVNETLPARILYPSYGQATQFNAKEIDLTKKCYFAQAKIVNNWLNDLLLIISSQLAFNELSIVFMADHGISLGDFNICGKPKDSPILPPAARIPMAVKLPSELQNTLTSKAFVQPHHITQIVLDYFELPIHMGNTEFEFPIWGRNSPFSKHLQVLYDGNIICISRSEDKDIILSVDIYTSEDPWDRLPTPDAQILKEIRGILKASGESQWLNFFL